MLGAVRAAAPVSVWSASTSAPTVAAPANIVLDPVLVLHPWGSLLSTWVRRVASVWMPNEVFAALDSPRAWLEDPSAWVPSTYPRPVISRAERGQSVATGLRGWKHNWASERGQVSCLETTDEANPTRNVDGLQRRHQLLSSALEERVDGAESRFRGPEMVRASFVDVAALSATLARFGGYALCAGEAGTGAFAFCDHLTAWGLDVEEVDAVDRPSVQVVRGQLMDAGLDAAPWLGIDLALVQILVPAAFDPDEDPWQGARTFWWRL